MDVNRDGYPDLITAGNFYDLLPQFCRLDASYGQVFLNDKKGNFIELPISQSGLNLIGQTRDIISVKIKKDDYILFLENNDFPLLYKMQLK
jgi:hypothetical protein